MSVFSGNLLSTPVHMFSHKIWACQTEQWHFIPLPVKNKFPLPTIKSPHCIGIKQNDFQNELLSMTIKTKTLVTNCFNSNHM